MYGGFVYLELAFTFLRCEDLNKTLIFNRYFIANKAFPLNHILLKQIFCLLSAFLHNFLSNYVYRKVNNRRIARYQIVLENDEACYFKYICTGYICANSYSFNFHLWFRLFKIPPCLREIFKSVWKSLKTHKTQHWQATRPCNGNSYRNVKRNESEMEKFWVKPFLKETLGRKKLK